MIKIKCLIFLMIITSIHHSAFSQGLDKAELIIEPMPPITIEPTIPSEKPIEIASMKVNGKIYGHLAETEMTLSFYNPNTRSISADVIFPIPSHSSIAGYALDVNGVMVDGVVVEKNKARVVFDKIVRQGIDPGLIEKVQGNVFKTRIFPLMPNQSRTISIRLLSVLRKNNDGYDYQVPLMTGQKINQFDLQLNVMNMGQPPRITSSDFNGVAFNKWQQFYVTEFKQKNFILNQALTVELPQVTQNIVVIGKNQQQEHFFSIDPSWQKINPLVEAAQPQFNKIQLIWDASHSRFGQSHQKELDFLQAFFIQNPDVEVELYILRNTLKSSGQFRVVNGQWSEIKQQLEGLHYDGATDLSLLSQLRKAQSLDGVLFFTDGLHTFSKKSAITVSVPLFVINSSMKANPNYNQKIAEENQGKYIDLTGKQDLQQLVKQLTQPMPQLLSIDIVKGQVDLLPQLPKIMSIQQTINGRLLSDQATLILNYGFWGQKSQSMTLNLSKSDTKAGNLVEKNWAQQQLQYLQKDSHNNKQAIIKLSQKYGFASDFTSLLVLENLEQYLEHEIAPPESLVQMRQDYFNRLKTINKNKHQEMTDKIEQVVQMWQERKKWWKKDFPVWIKKKANKQGTRQINRNENNQDDEFETITVTGSNVRAVPLENQVPATVVARDALSADMASEESEIESKQEKKSVATHATVKISAWDPDTPYLKALKAEPQKNRSNLYYYLKKQYHNSPAFYFDSANFFFKNQQKDFALQVLSNIVELKIQDSRLLRTMAMKLNEYDYLDLTIETYRQVLKDRDEEPQSFRDLALVLQKRAFITKSQQDYQEALQLLYQVITNKWDRFHGIEVTALMEINQLIHQAKPFFKLDYSMIDERLLILMDVDVRITLSWDSDMTDIDLWVIEPNNEKVYYSHKLSQVGGMFYKDFTGGYGPEEYLIRKAPKGAYQIKVHFYGNRSPELSGATTLYVDVFTNYGRPSQTKKTLSLRLDKADDDYLVGTIDIDL